MMGRRNLCSFFKLLRPHISNRRQAIDSASSVCAREIPNYLAGHLYSVLSSYPWLPTTIPTTISVIPSNLGMVNDS